MTVEVSTFQLLLSLLLQIWLIAFPIIIIKKLNYLTDYIQSKYPEDFDQENDDTDQEN